MATKRKPRAPKTEQPTRPPCECGCGGTPKSPKSRFLPGHDAKHLSALKKAEAAK